MGLLLSLTEPPASLSVAKLVARLKRSGAIYCQSGRRATSRPPLIALRTIGIARIPLSFATLYPRFVADVTIWPFEL